jgi:hypothetical protein
MKRNLLRGSMNTNELTNVRIAKIEPGTVLGERMVIGKVKLQTLSGVEQIVGQTAKAILVSLNLVGPTNDNGHNPEHRVELWFPKSKIFVCEDRVYVHESFLQGKLFKSFNHAFRNDY